MKSDWQERFKNDFTNKRFYSPNIEQKATDYFTKFIERLIANAKKEERERIIEDVKVNYHPYSLGCVGCRPKTLNEIKELIKTLKGE